MTEKKPDQSQPFDPVVRRGDVRLLLDYQGGELSSEQLEAAYRVWDFLDCFIVGSFESLYFGTLLRDQEEISEDERRRYRDQMSRFDQMPRGFTFSENGRGQTVLWYDAQAFKRAVAFGAAPWPRFDEAVRNMHDDAFFCFSSDERKFEAWMLASNVADGFLLGLLDWMSMIDPGWSAAMRSTLRL